MTKPQSSFTTNPERDNCRLAVYDDKGEFLGYKTDSEWNISKECFKRHPEKDTGIEKHLLRNLLWFLNDTSHGLRKLANITIVIERISEIGDVIKEVDRYLVIKGVDEIFIAKQA